MSIGVCSTEKESKMGVYHTIAGLDSWLDWTGDGTNEQQETYRQRTLPKRHDLCMELL